MIPMIRFFEEYASNAEKRAVVRAAKPLRLRKCTGKARGYIMVEKDKGGRLDATASIFHMEQGDGPLGLSMANPSYQYLREKCRAVGFIHMPKAWQQAFANYLNNAMADIEPSPLRRQYERLIRVAGLVPVKYQET
jgi:hypothetical protein